MTGIKMLYDKIYYDGKRKAPKAFIDIYEETKSLIEGTELCRSKLA